MREVVLFTTVVAVAAMGTRDMSPGRALDTAASPVNNTDFLRISEEEIVFDHWNSTADRAKVENCANAGGKCLLKKTVNKTCNGIGDRTYKCDKKNYVCCISGRCTPTISCAFLGGYCFKGRNSNCDGTVDPWGCRGKKCKCCIPGTTSCTPGTTATTTATAKTTPTIDPRCAAIDGFLMSNQCYKLYTDQKRSWTEAQNKCQEDGLKLSEIPDEDAVPLRKFIVDNYGEGYVWLGARGTGSQMRWERSGEEIMSSNALWWPGGYSSSSNRCLWLVVSNWFMQLQPTRPYLATRCLDRMRTLCEVVME